MGTMMDTSTTILTPPQSQPSTPPPRSSSPAKSKSWFSSKPFEQDTADPAVTKKTKRKSLVGTKTKVAGATVAVVGGAAVVASAAATVATAGAVAAAGGLVAGGVWLRGKAKGSSRKEQKLEPVGYGCMRVWRVRIEY